MKIINIIDASGSLPQHPTRAHHPRPRQRKNNQAAETTVWQPGHLHAIAWAMS
jgi:hypothetical protein